MPFSYSKFRLKDIYYTYLLTFFFIMKCLVNIFSLQTDATGRGRPH